jgi:hypothetical protein
VYQDGAFHVTLLGQPLLASWHEFGLTTVHDNCPAVLLGDLAQILIIRFLLEGAVVPSSGKFLTYRELPWGDVYDSNFQGRCVKRLAFTFGNRLESFIAAAEKLGGKALSLSPGVAEPSAPGDTPASSARAVIETPPRGASVELRFFEDVFIRLIVYAGDDEFPPSAQFLFSDNAWAAFTAEDLAAAGDLVISALKAAV